MLKPLVVGGVATILAFAIGFQLSLLGSVLPVLALAIPFAAAIAMAAAVLLQRPALATTATGLLLLSYGLVVTGRSGSIVAISTVGLVAGGTFLTLQLGWWAVELRTPAHEDQPAILREAARVTTAAVAVALAAEIAVLIAEIPIGAGVVAVIVGVTSLAAVVTVAIVLAASEAPATAGTTRVAGAAPAPFRAGGPPSNPWSRLLGWARRTTVGSPLTLSRPRSRQDMAATTGLTLLLLGADALVVLLGLAAHLTSATARAVRSTDSTAVAELAVLMTGAVLLNWLVRLLMHLSRPAELRADSVPQRGAPPETPSELDLIAHACRNVSPGTRLTGDLQRMLVALATKVGEPGLADQLAASGGGTASDALARQVLRGSLAGPLDSSLSTRGGPPGSEPSVQRALAALEVVCGE
ncbi:MAG: hypothetical protein WBU92_02285 [Candidatus Dormiibacterota bacterium]